MGNNNIEMNGQLVTVELKKDSYFLNEQMKAEIFAKLKKGTNRSYIHMITIDPITKVKSQKCMGTWSVKNFRQIGGDDLVSID